MTPEKAMQEIAALIEKACNAGHVDAASAALVLGGEAFEVARGFANKPEGITATPETLFHIGSVTKSLTAEMLWTLIGEGKLDASMPVAEAAPELARIATLADPRLTLAHLLSHTGGIDGDVIFDCGRGKDVLRRYMMNIGEIGSLHAPGAHFSYANIGYGILGRIVELASGMAFEDRLAKQLRDAHGLKQVAILPIEKIRQRTAFHFTNGTPDWFGPHSNIASGTVLAMSMGDLARWASHHLPGARADLPTAQMRAQAIALPHNHRYEGWGHGFTLMDGMGETLFGHDGGTAGTGTFMRIAPGQGAAWAMSATGPGSVALYREAEPYLRVAAGVPEGKRRVPSGGPVPQSFDLYEGVYGRYGMEFRIETRDGTLTLVPGGALNPASFGALALRPLTRDVFEAAIPSVNATVWISFHEFDASGKPQLLFALERMARRSGDLPR